MSSIIRWRSGVVFSSFIATSCLTGGKTHIVSPERPHTKSNAELGAERQQQAPMPWSGLVLPPLALVELTSTHRGPLLPLASVIAALRSGHQV